MTPLDSWITIALGVLAPCALLYCTLILSGRISDEERKVEAELHRHVCSRCGRVQRWLEPFDQFSPCRGCQLAMDSVVIRHREIDLDDFADADALRVYLDGADIYPGADVPRSTGPAGRNALGTPPHIDTAG